MAVFRPGSPINAIWAANDLCVHASDSAGVCQELAKFFRVRGKLRDCNPSDKVPGPTFSRSWTLFAPTPLQIMRVISSRNRRNGGRNNGRNNNNRRNTRVNNVSVFKGTVTDMNGHVFQCYGEATENNEFARTVEELDAYVGLQFKNHPGHVKTMIKTMQDTKIVIPKDHDTEASKTPIRIWEKKVDIYVKRLEFYVSNKCALYSVIWSQCSEAMQAKIKSDDGFEATHKASDSLNLMQIIKGIAYKFESQKNVYLALDNAKCAFYTSHQAADGTDAAYMSKFQNSVE